MEREMQYFALLLNHIHLIPFITGSALVPGRGCGIIHPVRTLESLPKDFDGDISAFACTYLKNDEEYKKHLATLPGTNELKHIMCTVHI